MRNFRHMMSSVWLFYRDGFRNMTWGRPLIWLILLKVFILFAILRIFFFKPVMAGLNDEERSRVVGERIATPPETPDSPTYNL